MKEIGMQLLIICPLIFFAGFVDSIAGGGGIISVPAYIVAGLPPTMALGTNKFSSTFGSITAALKFIKNKKYDIKSASIAATFAIIGASIGSSLAVKYASELLSYLLIIILPILTIFMIFSKNVGDGISSEQITNKRIIVLSTVIGLSLGMYDGFFGPGTGTFLILAFNMLIGFDLLTSSGNAKIVNLSSNIGSIIVFAIHRDIIFSLAIPAALASIMGSYIGSSLAIKNGSKLIRPIFVFVILLLLSKISYDLFINK
jgi:uncharacterized protein